MIRTIFSFPKTKTLHLISFCFRAFILRAISIHIELFSGCVTTSTGAEASNTEINPTSQLLSISRDKRSILYTKHDVFTIDYFFVYDNLYIYCDDTFFILSRVILQKQD